MENEQALFINMVLDGWNAYIKRTDELFDSLSDEQLLKEVSPNRNRGIYLLGHLACVHDKMLPLLDFEKQRYPQLDKIFLHTPDKAVEELPPIEELRGYWKEVNQALSRHFGNMQDSQWFQKHTAVSEADFAKEPYRNRLNLIINRTSHLASHYGQLVFLKKKNE